MCLIVVIISGKVYNSMLRPINPHDARSGGVAVLEDFDVSRRRPRLGAAAAPTPPSGEKSTSEPAYVTELPYPEELQAMLGGAYLVESFLGQGGMGAVYAGLQLPLRRPVAIKILARGQAAGFSFEERFRREAYAMAALTHPHIVQVYDCGDAGEQFLFISMEYVGGGDLGMALKEGRVSVDLALKILPGICDGLQAAH